MTQSASNIVPASVSLAMTNRLYSDLFDAEQASIYRLALMLCGSPHVAEEIVAEVFAKVLPKWRQGTLTDPEFYLRRAVLNEVRSRHRRRVNERRALARHATREATKALPEPATALGSGLVAAMQQLTVRHRAVIVLRFHDDLSEAEVAHILGSPPGTIKGQTSRALAALRALMEEEK